MPLRSPAGDKTAMDLGSIDIARREYEQERPKYETFANRLQTLHQHLVERAGVAVESITSRAKEPASLANRLAEKGTYDSWQDRPDLVGVRIVTRYKADVDVICKMIEDEFEVIEKVIHGAHEADAFGYRSWHLIVRLSESRASLSEWAAFPGLHAEIQVRSILQHAWATISHSLDYKSDGAVPKEVRRQLFRVAALLETGDDLFDDFRKQVEALRLTYRTEVFGDDWRELPLNFDSLIAAVDKLPLAEVEEAAIAAHWSSAPEQELPKMPKMRTLLSRLASVASAAGYKTIGSIADLMQECIDDPDWLVRVAEGGAKQDYRPWAIPSDVALLRAVSKHSNSEATMEAAYRTDIVPELIGAAVEASVVTEPDA
jgi:ppGpp synthetase/RelA/SpoT-type nucleotidyltranferase